MHWVMKFIHQMSLHKYLLYLYGRLIILITLHMIKVHITTFMLTNNVMEYYSYYSYLCLYPTGEGLGPLFHPWVYPNPIRVFSGAGFKSHPWVTRRAPKISLI
jgi:hypothetical protein